jgi:hypothetical protein
MEPAIQKENGVHFSCGPGPRCLQTEQAPTLSRLKDAHFTHFTRSASDLFHNSIKQMARFRSGALVRELGPPLTTTRVIATAQIEWYCSTPETQC